MGNHLLGLGTSSTADGGGSCRNKGAADDVRSARSQWNGAVEVVATGRIESDEVARGWCVDRVAAGQSAERWETTDQRLSTGTELNF